MIQGVLDIYLMTTTDSGNAGRRDRGRTATIPTAVGTRRRRARKRHRFSLTFVTPEPFLGHFGVNGIGMSPRMIQDEFAERHIDAIVNAAVAEARPDRLILAGGLQLPFDFSLVVPAFLGAAFLGQADGLANPRGFVPVTPHLTSPRFGNVHAVGVAVAIAPPGPTPVPVAVPKTGHMTELMAQAAAHNIVADLCGGAKVDGLSLPVTCIADAGDTAFYLSADPFLPPRNRVVHKRGNGPATSSWPSSGTTWPASGTTGPCRTSGGSEGSPNMRLTVATKKARHPRPWLDDHRPRAPHGRQHRGGDHPILFEDKKATADVLP